MRAMKRRLIAILAPAALLVACAGGAPPKDLTGRSEADVIQAMGQPTGRYTLPNGGTRLEYAKGPAGDVTYMVDLDAQGRVVKMDQVLDAEHFDVVSAGMKSEALLRFIGRPCARDGVRGGGQIWSWRYVNSSCLWWQAQLDAQDVVVSTGYGPLPGCGTGP